MSETTEPKKRRGRPRKSNNSTDPNVLNSETKESNAKTITDPILEPYYITMDQYCYTVYEKIIPDNEEGKVYTKSSGHYSNIGSCLEAISKRKVNSKSYNSISAFIKEYQEIINSLNPLRTL